VKDESADRSILGYLVTSNPIRETQFPVTRGFRRRVSKNAVRGQTPLRSRFSPRRFAQEVMADLMKMSKPRHSDAMPLGHVVLFCISSGNPKRFFRYPSADRRSAGSRILVVHARPEDNPGDALSWKQFSAIELALPLRSGCEPAHQFSESTQEGPRLEARARPALLILRDRETRTEIIVTLDWNWCR